MKCDLCLTYLGETERPLKLLALLFHGELPASPIGIGERVITVASLKPGIAWIFPVFAASEEIVKRFLDPHEHILQDLAMKRVIFLSEFFDLRKLVSLAVVGYPYLTAPLFAGWLVIVVGMLSHMKVIGITPFSQCSIIEVAAGIKCFLQAFALLASGIQSEFVGSFRHAFGSQYTA